MATSRRQTFELTFRKNGRSKDQSVHFGRGQLASVYIRTRLSSQSGCVSHASLCPAFRWPEVSPASSTSSLDVSILLLPSFFFLDHRYVLSSLVGEYGKLIAYRNHWDRHGAAGQCSARTSQCRKLPEEWKGGDQGQSWRSEWQAYRLLQRYAELLIS